MFSILGVLEGLVVIGVVFLLSTKDASGFYQLTPIVYMTGSLIALTLMTFPVSDVFRAFKHFLISLLNEDLYARKDKDEILRVARIRYRDDPFALERALEEIKSPFLKTGVQLLIDKVPLKETQNLLEWRIKRLTDREEGEAEIFATLANYTIVVSFLAFFIQLSNLALERPQESLFTLSNIFHTLLPVSYGMLVAFLVFKPMAMKLRRRTRHRLEILGMVQENIAIMYSQQRPGLIRETLRSFSNKIPDEFKNLK